MLVTKEMLSLTIGTTYLGGLEAHSGLEPTGHFRMHRLELLTSSTSTFLRRAGRVAAGESGTQSREGDEQSWEPRVDEEGW